MESLLEDSTEVERGQLTPPSSSNSSKWTGMASVTKVVAPTSENYDDWTADQIRRECTARNLKVPKSMKKEPRIQLLKDFDALKQKHGAMLEAKCSKTTERTVRSPNCMYRLLNVLFSPGFAEQFAQLGNNPIRAEIDEQGSGRSSSFWKKVEAAFKSDSTMAFDELIMEHDLIRDIDPSKIVPHDANKLQAMWGEVNRRYIKSQANFTASGTHESDFSLFCDGRGDVLYLHEWLKLKPGLNGFVKGGMNLEDEFDSIATAPTTSTLSDTDRPNTVRKKRKAASSDEPSAAMQQVADAVKAMASSQAKFADAIAGKEADSRKDCISIYHDCTKKISELKSLLKAAENEGDSNEVEELKEGILILQRERTAARQRLS